MFDTRRTAAMDPAERRKVVLALAGILMQAAGLTAEDLTDDEE